jgi:hypothetical protein
MAKESVEGGEETQDLSRAQGPRGRERIRGEQDRSSV